MFDTRCGKRSATNRACCLDYDHDGDCVFDVVMPRDSSTPRRSRAEPMLSRAFVTAQIQSEVDDLVRHYLKRNMTVDQIIHVVVWRLNSMDPHGKQVTA